MSVVLVMMGMIVLLVDKRVCHEQRGGNLNP